MLKETMTPQERVQAAINLEVPDRVPVLPLQTFFFACRHKGLDGYEMVKQRERARQAHMEVYDELGGFDGQVVPGISYIFPGRLSGIVREPLYKIPGIDLPRDSVIQCDEAEILQPEDYDLIADLGWKAFAEKYYGKFNPRNPSEILSWGERQTASYCLPGRRGFLPSDVFLDVQDAAEVHPGPSPHPGQDCSCHGRRS